jgi:hypothetical protein
MTNSTPDNPDAELESILLESILDDFNFDLPGICCTNKECDGYHPLQDKQKQKAVNEAKQKLFQWRDRAVEEATNFKKECKPYNRERRYEAACRAIQKHIEPESKLGVDYSLIDFGAWVCDELERVLLERVLYDR